MATRLTDAETAALTDEPFTYAPIGATAAARETPAGYHGFTRSRRLRRTDFSTATDELLGWRMHERAGLRVTASADRAATGAVVRMLLGPGGLALSIPCRVVCEVTTPGQAGFAYGTLPGHPECGEELFLLTREADGAIRFTIRAFSRPATWSARAAGPVGRWAQRVMTDRYISAMDC